MVSLKLYLDSQSTTVSNLLFDYYKEVGMTHEEFILYLQLLRYQQMGDVFPSVEKIGRQMGYTSDKCFIIIQSLVEKNIISIETNRNEHGLTEDKYDLSVVYEKLGLYFKQQETVALSESDEDKRRYLFQQFEQEFGRPLSPMELEMIQQWLEEDKYSIDLLELGLREAVLNQAYSLKYIDRILLAWERKNLKTKQAVQRDQERRMAQIEEKESFEVPEGSLPRIPMHNWLNNSGK